MRFERLSIPAFGPFTDFTLEFPLGQADCHLIYGRNEAGKSSLLRAMRDLLYGIHVQTPDNFRHDYKHLRIAGTVSNSSGQKLSFQRRKGRTNTLLDAAGNVLPDDALESFLGPVDREYFSTMFGLGVEELRQGAQALLHGRGELGQALFSASLAGTPVHAVLEQLDAEARSLFDGRARSKVRIRPAVEAYRESLRLSRTDAVNPQTWDELLAELEDASKAKDRLDAELSHQRTRRDWLQRCLDALPTLGLLDEQERRLAELAPTPPLGAAFVADSEQALAVRDGARSLLEQLNLRITSLRTRQREKLPDREILARAAEIGSLHQHLAVYRQWHTEQVKLRARCAQSELELRAGMRQLDIDGEPDRVESLRARSADELALEETAQALRESRQELQVSDAERARRSNELTQLRGKLSALVTVDVSALRSILAETAGAAEAAKSLPRKQVELASAESAVAVQHGRLDGAPSDSAAVFRLPVPAAATLRRFEAELARIDAAGSSTEADSREAGDRVQEIAGQLQRLGRRGDLPSIAALQQARRLRDQGWEQVLAAWKGEAEEVELDGRPLAEAYPLSVQQADRIADRLREDAGLVAQAEELNLQLQQALAVKARADAELEVVRARAGDWQERWNNAWAACAIVPGTPAEMLEWRELWTEYGARYEAREKASVALAAAQTEIEAATDLLAPLFPAVGSQSLAALREQIDHRIRAADEARGEARQLRAQIHGCETDLEKLAAARAGLTESAAAAHRDWQQACQVFGLPPETGVETGLALLEQRRNLVAVYDVWSALQQEIREKQQAMDRYTAAVNALADAFGLAAGTLEVRESALWTELENARALDSLQNQLQNDLEQELTQLPGAEQALAAAQRKVDDCQATCGASNELALRSLLRDLQLHMAIQAEIERLRQTLHVSARGEPLDRFISRVRTEPGDGLASARDALDEAIDNLQVQRDQALKRLGNAQERKREFEQSGARASGHLQAARSSAVRIRHDAERYLRLRLAISFLRSQIEQFRKQNQAPLLSRAGEIFNTVTEGSFDRLGTAFAEDDTPVLVAVRRSSEVDVQGMSDGTRDQLYLSLRLAAIERHQQDHEPMPLILDDLLVTFDDQRVRAILPILSELGKKTQVMLFTHHRHLAELAAEVLTDEELHRHRL